MIINEKYDNNIKASLAQRQSASLLSWWSRVRSPQGALFFFKVISGKTVKALGSRQERSEWNLFTLYSVKKNLVKVYDYYKVVKNNITLKDNKKEDYSKLMECNILRV